MEIRILHQITFLLLAFFYFQVDCSWSLSSFLNSSSHLCLPNQRAALLEIKNTISLSDYCQFVEIKTNSWNQSTDCCSWEGVSCNKLTGHVIAIDLSGSCLSGSLLANSSLFQLRGLQRLNLSQNDFSGSISSELFKQLVSLTHLDLSDSRFSGLIPNVICLLSNLVSLDLSHSDLIFNAQSFDMLARNSTKLRNLVLEYTDMSSVSVSSFKNFIFTSSLESLSLRSCQLQGEFPSEVFQQPNLQYVDLAWNENVTGYLPKTNMSRALKVLDLYYCHFKGPIPVSLGNLTQITFLEFYQNDFDGQIPDVFENLKELTILSVGYCNFSGKFPMTIFNLSKLTQLDLSYNLLEGSLPTHVSELQLLEYFSLSNNLLSGGVPSWLFTLPSLITIDLSYNKLSGPIDQTQKPNSLLGIDLSFNEIHGSIPNSLFDLVNLSSLHLSSNNLSGVIESDKLSKLKKLSILDVSNNSLLSLITTGNDVNYSFPELAKVSFSSCNIKEFPSFLQTSTLEALDLSNNKISGKISKWEAEGWERLTMLNLSYNFLTSLEQFPGKYLKILDLHSNLLQGPILSNCLNPQLPNPPISLSIFLISDNNLSGRIPSLICNCTSLVVLDLSNNSLSGSLPKCLGNVSYGLKFMNLQMNHFHGNVPDSFMNYQLSHLFLNDNQLEGSLPPSLTNCSSLEVLNLGNNNLADTFPHWLASLPKLQVLILRFNRLHGYIPNSIAATNFSALRIIDLSHNELTGPLPTNLFRSLKAMKETPTRRPPVSYLYKTDARIRYVYESYPTSVVVTVKRSQMELAKTLEIFVAMDFSYNLLHGQIPEELGQLISLQMLNFSHNNFSGPIPSSLGDVVALESLDLSSNKLEGEMPSQLTDLTFLSVLNVSENDLVGPIPHGFQFDTFDNDSYNGNLGLCGSPLSKQCGNNEEGSKSPEPMYLDNEGFEIPIFWEAMMMGYGCGIVLGISIGYIVFTTGKPWWIVRKIERDWQNKVSNWIRRNGRSKKQ